MWLKKGICDSKRLSDARVLELEKVIRGTASVAVAITAPSVERYNALYDKFRNLNHLLAWEHAKGLENALAKRQVPWGMLDQFSKQMIVPNYAQLPESFVLKQQVRAESDPIVAGASICARACYLRSLDALSEDCGMALPKGAGVQAKEALHRLAHQEGMDALGRFAKLHFKTVKDLKDVPL